MYAVLDRVDFSGLSDSEPVMLPGVDPFSLFSNCTVKHHISSQHTEKMSSQSKVVIYL